MVHVNEVRHMFDPNDDIFRLEMTNSKPLHKVKSGLEQNCFSCEVPLKKKEV